MPPKREVRKSRSPNKGRDKTKSLSPGKGRKNIKGHRPQDWSKEELLDRTRKFGTFSLDNLTGSATLAVANKKLMSEELSVINELLTRCKFPYVSLRTIFFSSHHTLFLF